MTFTARNGVQLWKHPSGSVEWEPGQPHGRVTAALREYFEAERDIELGRWRFPDAPRFVVYPLPAVSGHDRGLRVVDESDGTSVYIGENANRPFDQWQKIAAAYLEAHPYEKPWRDESLIGDVWEITVKGVERAAILGNNGDWLLGDGHTIATNAGRDENIITAGRLIYRKENV